MSTESALVARSLSEDARKLLFTEARTHQNFLPVPVEESKLKELYELWKWGPTSANTCPLRVVYVTSAEGKAKLSAVAMDSNKEKIEKAPVVAILAWDSVFYDQLPRLMPPFAFFKDVLAANEPMAKGMGQQSANLSGGYFILAARAVGLDAGPMGGFSADGVDAAFFANKEGAQSKWKSLLLINLGYGDASKVYPRGDRLGFEEACSFE